jgi:hypothetical protein
LVTANLKLPNDYDNVPSLSQLKCLKNLRFTGVILSHLFYDDVVNPLEENLSDMLPRTLETLHTIDAVEGLCETGFEYLRKFVIDELDQVPNLRKIFIEGNSWRDAPLD